MTSASTHARPWAARRKTFASPPAASKTPTLAAGDIFECFLQSLSRNSSATAGDNRNLIGWVNGIVQIYCQEAANPKAREKHSFILIGHSQGNFLVEGMAWRLQNLAGDDGKALFNTRLAVLALASPTDYPSVQQNSAEGTRFVGKRLLHATRRDDAILASRAPGPTPLTKVPFNANLPALWAYKQGQGVDAVRDKLLRLKAALIQG